jgi:hypothetical protein
MTSILGELFKAGKDIGKEMKRQVFGSAKKQKASGSRISIHYHFYREKKPRHNRGSRG